MKTPVTIFLFIITILPLTLPSCTTSTIDKTKIGKNEKAGRYVNTRGFKMYYEIYGKGEPLLMIHGNGGSINHFVHQVPYFSENYKVIIADGRAQGNSVDAGDSLSYEMMADDLNALLDSLHLDSCYVIGWSDGGINGLLLALRHPEKVKKLVSASANLFPDTSAIDPFIYNWAMNYNDSLKKIEQTPEVKNERKLAHLLSFEPHITTTELNTIKCPTLVIGGDHDIILPKHTLLIAESIPKSYVWIVPNSGHGTPIAHKEQFNKLVNDFFKKPYRKIQGAERFR